MKYAHVATIESATRGYKIVVIPLTAEFARGILSMADRARAAKLPVMSHEKVGDFSFYYDDFGEVMAELELDQSGRDEKMVMHGEALIEDKNLFEGCKRETDADPTWMVYPSGTYGLKIGTTGPDEYEEYTTYDLSLADLEAALLEEALGASQ